jgi:hypothetical protein
MRKVLFSILWFQKFGYFFFLKLAIKKNMLKKLFVATMQNMAPPPKKKTAC